MEFKLHNNKNDWHQIREDIFMKEQGFQSEFDDLDAVSTHITAYIEQKLVGCARCYADEKNVWHIGRIAVYKAYRKLGVGAQIVNYCEELAITKQLHTCVLDAQLQAVPFYEKSGYQIIGEVHMDEHVPHVEMRKQVASIRFSK